MAVLSGVLMSLLTACGGGGGGADADTSADQVAAISSAPPAPAIALTSSAAHRIEPATPAPEPESVPDFTEPSTQLQQLSESESAQFHAEPAFPETKYALASGTLADGPIVIDSAPATAQTAVPAIATEELPRQQDLPELTPVVLNSEAPSLAAITAPLTAAMQAADIIAELNSAKPNTQQTWYGVNCYGIYGPITRLPNGEVHGSRLPDGSTLRMGKVNDQLKPGRKVFMVRVGKNDVLTAGGKRCELIAYGDGATSLPVGKEIWYGVSILVNEGLQSRGDDQILMQWHVNGFNPFFAVALKDGRLRAEVRHNAFPGGTAANAQLERLWIDDKPVQRRWMTFVVNAKISTFSGDAPFIKVWRDGELIADRKGPLGYNTTEYHYARIGFYHWINSGNTWDASSPVRSLMFSRSFVARDPSSKYNEPSVRAYVESD